jgi:hypothetical protein
MVRKNLACKAKEARFKVAPRLTPQSRFPAGLLQELFARQVMFDSHLRQEKPALCVEHHQQAMTPYLNRLRGDRRRRRKQGDLNREVPQLVRPQRGKPRIFQSRAGGTTDDGCSKRFIWFNDTDATLQAPTKMQCYKHTTALRENSVTGN